MQYQILISLYLYSHIWSTQILLQEIMCCKQLPLWHNGQSAFELDHVEISFYVPSCKKIRKMCEITKSEFVPFYFHFVLPDSSLKSHVEQKGKSWLDFDFHYKYKLRNRDLSILSVFIIWSERCQKSYHRDNWFVAAKHS